MTENFSVDIAHDIFEGVAVTILTQLLHTFIFEEELFDLDTLNSRIRHSNFGISNNRHPLITNTLLRKIVKIILKRFGTSHIINELENRIRKHHSLFITLFVEILKQNLIS